MSELKAYKGDIYVPMYGSIADAKVYLKSEADKVIADLEESHKMEVEQLLMEIVELKDRLQAANEQNENLINSASRIMLFQDRVNDDKCAELRHQKYKRCLAMAKICEDKLGTVVKPGWWNKWHKRWLGLAEKFKEGV